MLYQLYWVIYHSDSITIVTWKRKMQRPNWDFNRCFTDRATRKSVGHIPPFSFSIQLHWIETTRDHRIAIGWECPSMLQERKQTQLPKQVTNPGPSIAQSKEMSQERLKVKELRERPEFGRVIEYISITNLFDHLPDWYRRLLQRFALFRSITRTARGVLLLFIALCCNITTCKPEFTSLWCRIIFQLKFTL